MDPASAQLSPPELRRLCLDLLRALPGLEDTTDIIIMAAPHHRGPSWEILRIFPPLPLAVLEGAMEAIERLQDAFDLRVEHWDTAARNHAAGSFYPCVTGPDWPGFMPGSSCEQSAGLIT